MPEMRVLASGHMVWVDEKGHAEFMVCSWIVGERYIEGEYCGALECGARWLHVPGYPDGWRCENGHEHLGIQAEWAIDGQIEQAEHFAGREMSTNDRAHARDTILGR